LKSGAFAATAGSSPFVWIGFPLSVIWAMGALLCVELSDAPVM
jgi:hypothetical protein